MSSRNCADISRADTAPVRSRMRSASVDFPWSMWAMMEKLRMRAVSSVASLRREIEGLYGAGGGPASVERDHHQLLTVTVAP